ncbi:ribonuclease HII [Corynebacterium glyciniphilum]|uniref:ribonuclease HII n=1 Tax=Corynebacterium glyciniphilum TaxID=1404244 RepID=UPI0026525D98|nr:ribonuclease HII [Corynebacterium glyciniphilum]MDN6707204.1 ribonuclease HII [Corynebacterium glyciniphilum]
MPDGRTLEWAVHKAGLGPVAGVDEAGRGACCGPVTVAACVLPPGPIPELSGLTDSKKLTPKKRDHFFDVVREVAEDWAVVHVPASYVDTWGIQHANLGGMRRAVARLDVRPGYILTDAMKVNGFSRPHLPVVKGDLIARCISAASVLAKVSRDRLMGRMDSEYPGYGLAGHKGYGTASHMASVSLLGGTPEHRYTYSNVAAAHRRWQAGPPIEEGDDQQP